MLRSKHSGWTWEGKRTPFFGGGGGGGGQTTSTGTTYNTNIPEYAQPYVETMLGATQKQLFDMSGNEITGFKPYKPYSTDLDKYTAGFQPLQEKAMTTTGNLQTPGQFGDATTLAGAAGLGSLGAGQQYARNVTDPSMMQSYMSPYQQNVTDIAKMNAVREAQMAQNAQNLGAARQGTYGGARQTLAQSERERNLLSNLSNIQAQGSQSAFDRAMQAQQFGSTLGMQGYGQAGQAASTLGQLGGQQLGAQKDIIGLQSQVGKEQQALEQAKINQQIQDFATQQQYPLMQLGFMSNMLRGLPLQATTTQSYQAQPSGLNQGLALLGGAAGAKQAGLFNEGGTIKGLAAGGVAGYANRGMVQANPDSSVVRGIRQKLMMMDADELNRVAQSSPSEEIRKMAIEILQEQKIREQAEVQAQQSIAQDQRGLPTPVTERAGLPAAPAGAMDTLNAASGGIVAFAGEDESLVEDETTRLQKDFANREAVAKFLAQRRKDAGIGAPKAELAKFYTEEQARIAEDRKRKGGYDLINYSLELGTQPGGLLQAGFQAGKRVLPGMIAREDALRGRESDIAKGLAEISEADRLMQLGDFAGADAIIKDREDRKSKEKVAGMKSPGELMGYANNYLARKRAEGDKRPDAVLLNEGMDELLGRRGAAVQRADTAAVIATGNIGNKIVEAHAAIDKLYVLKLGLAKKEDKPRIQAEQKAEKEKAERIIKGGGTYEAPKPGNVVENTKSTKSASSKANPADFDTK